MVQMNLVSEQEQKHRHKEQTCGHRVLGEGEVNWENGFNINNLPVWNSYWKPMKQHMECNSVLYDDLEGETGVGGERGTRGKG